MRLKMNLPFFIIAVLIAGSSCVAYGKGLFDGEWFNPDETKHGGLSRLEVTRNGDALAVQCWALSGDKEVSLGTTNLTLLGEYTVCPGCIVPPSASKVPTTPHLLSRPLPKSGFAHIDHGFADVFLTFRLQDGKLLVEDFNVFKDGSGRQSYRSEYELVIPAAINSAAHTQEGSSLPLGRPRAKPVE